jgi:xylulokinase
VSQRVLLGIDVGTSAAKAVLADERAGVIASGSGQYDLESPRTGWTQQRASWWWEGVVCAVGEALRRAPPDVRVEAIGLSGQMHGCVLVDDHALRHAATGPIDAVGPVLLWNDQRTASQCRTIHERAGGRPRLVELVGNAALPGFTLPKILWLAEHRPDELRRARRLLLPKDFIALQLTAQAATDPGDASGTLLYDVRARRWHDGLSELFGVPRSLLPEVRESAGITGRLTAWAAERLGLPSGIPVATGSGDNQTAAVGAGVTEPGHALAVLGTSGVIYAPAASPRFDLSGDTSGRVQAGCDPAGAWCNTGCMLSAAGALAWARSILHPSGTVESLLDEAAAVPAGCDGVLFAPYLSGERCPHTDPTARGAWVGLAAGHTRGHLARAVLEGVAMSLAQIFRLIRGIGVPVETLRVTGGGARSALWRQILADAVGVPVEVPVSQEGSALGAAFLGAVAVGMQPDVRTAGALIHAAERVEPGPDRSVYAALATAYDALYPTLRPTFEAPPRVEVGESSCR